MKKFLVTCFYLSMTLAVCTAGFLLPSILSSYQDRQIFAKIEHPAMEPPELTYSSSLYDTLRLFSKEHYFVEYPSAGSKRTDAEIFEIACNVLEQLQAYDVISADFNYDITNYSALLQLAIVSEAGQDSSISSVTDTETSKESYAAYSTADSSSDITTAVVWCCSIYFDSGYWIDMWIDDKSGKAVSLSMFVEQTLVLTYTDKQHTLDEFANRTAKFAEYYYQLPANAVEQSFIRSYNSLFDKEKNSNIIEAYYSINMKNENGIMIQIPLKIRPECIIFN